MSKFKWERVGEVYEVVSESEEGWVVRGRESGKEFLLRAPAHELEELVKPVTQRCGCG